jgi:adenylate kinase family enzyme
MIIPTDLRRVVVLGCSCAGKSTFSAALASIAGAGHIELDALHWLPGWQSRDPDEFRGMVASAVAAERWVVDGGYLAVRDLVWPRATAVAWLDYSFPVVFGRALRRTIARIREGQLVHNGNVESFRRAFLSLDGIPWWVIRTYQGRRREFARALSDPAHAHLPVARFRRPADAEAFLSEVARLGSWK